MTRARYQSGTVQLKQRKRGDDVWVFRYYDENGKRRSKDIGSISKLPTQSDAERAAGGLRLIVNADSLGGRVIRFGALIDRFMAEELPERKSTARTDTGWVENYIRPRWADLTLEQVARPFPAEEWLKSLMLAPSSKAQIKSVMSKLFACAIRWEMLELRENPMKYVRVKDAGKTLAEMLPSRVEKLGLRPIVRKVLTVEQVQAVWEKLPEPFRTMAVVAACLGPRMSEIAGLQWADFDFNDGWLTIQRGIVEGVVDLVKTKASRDKLPLAEELQVAILEHKARTAVYGSEWVFMSPQTSRPYSMNYCRQEYLGPAGIACGLGEGLGWHSFRHTYSTLLRKERVDVKVQQSLLRHAQMSTTMDTYTIAVDDERRKANGRVASMLLPAIARA